MKRIAVAAVSVVAFLAILVAALPYIVPGEFLRGLVAAQVAAWTGRTVAVTGEPHLSIYPDLAITVEGLTVSNPQGASEEAFIAADGVRASVRLLPLLIGRAEFDEIELVQPRFRLIVAKDGTTNWRMPDSVIARLAERTAARLAENGAAVGNGGNGPNGAEARATDLMIGNLKVVDGIVLYDDLASDRREEMTAVDIDVSWPDASTAARGSGAFVWRGEPIKFNGSIEDPLALIAGGTSPVRVAVAATIFRGVFTGEASAEAPFRLDGRVSATTPSLRRAIAWTGVPVGQGAILGVASIEGAAHWAGAAVSFEDAVFELDGNRATGTLSAVFGGVRPALTGTMASERLDLTPYVEAARADITAEGPWPIAPAELRFAAAFDADVNVTASDVLVGATRLSAVDAGVTVRDGAISLNIADARFYGGALAARIGAGMVGDAMVAGIEADLSGLPVGAALADLVGIEAVTGTAAVRLSVESRGESYGEMARSMAGGGSIAITSGSLTGIDVIAIGNTIASQSGDGSLPLAGGTTPFSSLAATFALGNGAIATENLAMRGPGYAIELAGTASVISGIVNARGALTLGADRIGIAIGGRWTAPVISRDPAVEPTEEPTGQITTGGTAGATPTGG